MKRLAYNFFALIFVILFMSAAQAQESTSTPYPLAPSFHWQAFPDDLYCEDTGILSEGAKWDEVTVGTSSVNDLKHYVDSIGKYNVTQYANFVYFERIPNVLDGSGIPPIVEACLDVDTQTVTALRVSNNRRTHIDDLVTIYGRPDIVTWGNSNISRTVFWFKKGVAALVYVLEGSDTLDFGQIGLIVYFPYQSLEDFEEHWPYNRTNSENPIGGDRVYDPPPSEVQNPFDFEAMIATITAEPSRTPTPTFVPLSSTPTVTPTP